MAKAFTLLELIIVVAILALLAAVGWPSLNRYQGSARIQTGAEQATDFLRLANQAAASGWGNSSYGVKLFPDHLVLFKGGSYALRDASVDRSLSFDRGLSLAWQLSGLAAVDQLSVPSGNATGTIDFANVVYGLKFQNSLPLNYISGAQKGGQAVDEVIFAKNSGYPDAVGTVELLNSEGGKRQLVLNRLGLAELLLP